VYDLVERAHMVDRVASTDASAVAEKLRIEKGVAAFDADVPDPDRVSNDQA
jgi:hypothetical protein